MTLIEKLQPLMDEYTITKLKMQMLLNKGAIQNPVIWNQIQELQKVVNGIEKDIVNLIFEENKPIVEEKLIQLTA